MTGHDQFVDELALVAQRGVGLRNVVLGFFHGREIDDLVSHLAVHDLAVRGFDEPVLVDAREGGQRVDQADVGTFRRFDRADTAIMGHVNVADFKACALACQTARPKRRKTALVGNFRKRVGLIHELGKLGRTKELAHRSRSRLGVDEILGHHRVDLDRAHALLDGALHAQKAETIMVFHQFADRTHTAVAEVVDVVDIALAVTQFDQGANDSDDVFLAQNAHGVGRIEIETHVHLHAADRRKVIALAVKEQRVEHGFGGVDGGRLARTHHAVDVEQRVFAAFVLVHGQRVADIGTDIDVIDVEDRKLVKALLDQRFQHLLVDLVAGFGKDFAVGQVNDVAGKVHAVEIFVGGQQMGHTGFDDLLGGTGRQARSTFVNHVAGLGVDQIVNGLGALHLLGVEWLVPALFTLGVGLDIVIGVQDLFRVQAQGLEQRGHRDLAAAIDTRIDDVLGVEFDIEPAPAIGNDARGKQKLARRMGLALVVIEEHARRTVHLGDDDAFGAVDDEGAVRRHEGHVAHIDVLLLDVLDRAGAGVFVDLEHDQPQRHLERRGKGHVALAAFLDVIFGLLEFETNEFERRGVGKIGDREDRPEDRLEAFIAPPAFGLIDHQELIVRCLLHLDQVRHLRDFTN